MFVTAVVDNDHIWTCKAVDTFKVWCEIRPHFCCKFLANSDRKEFGKL